MIESVFYERNARYNLPFSATEFAVVLITVVSSKKKKENQCTFID